MDHQATCDGLHRDLVAGKLTGNGYEREMDLVYGKLPPDLRDKVDRRKDERTFGRWALDLHATTRRERDLVHAWARVCVAAYRIRIVDHGIANDGRVVLVAGRDAARHDFLATCPDFRRKLEVKFCPVPWFVTYKRVDLENYAKDPDTIVLTIFEERGDFRWFTMGPRRIRKVIRQGEEGHRRGFGGKATIRVYAAQYPDLFRVHPWQPLGRPATRAA